MADKTFWCWTYGIREEENSGVAVLAHDSGAAARVAAEHYAMRNTSHCESWFVREAGSNTVHEIAVDMRIEPVFSSRFQQTTESPASVFCVCGHGKSFHDDTAPFACRWMRGSFEPCECKGHEPSGELPSQPINRRAA
jgi:hypothetical protein